MERELLVQAAKIALAVALAWLLAGWVLHEPQPFVAPYAAIFVMTDTVYRSLASAVQQLFGLILGLVLAYAAIRLVHQPVAALAVAIFLAVLIGRWRRFGANGEWVPITALLMLTYGTAGDAGYLVVRVGQSLVGAAIGVGVNLLILPPVHLKRAYWAIQRLSGEISELLAALATGLRDDWDENDARAWLGRARALQSSVSSAERAIGKGDESIRLNPWRTAVRRSDRTLLPANHQSVVAALRRVAEQCQRMGEILLAETETYDRPVRPVGDFTATVAGLLDDLADSVATYHNIPAQPGDLRERLGDQLAGVRDQHQRLTSDIRRGEFAHPESWSVQGGLVLAIQHAVEALGSNRQDHPQDPG